MNKQATQMSNAKSPSARTVVEDAIAAAKKHDSAWIEKGQTNGWTQKDPVKQPQEP